MGGPITTEGGLIRYEKTTSGLPDFTDIYNPPLKDTGVRFECETGAHKEEAPGLKGRRDLIPLKEVGIFLTSYEFDEEEEEKGPSKCGLLQNIFDELELFMQEKDTEHLYNCLDSFMDICGWDPEELILEMSFQYEAGALKYGADNWRKGLPLSMYIGSAIGHLLKYNRGDDDDERHDRAFVWNIFATIWTLTNRPEMDDIRKDLSNVY